MLTITKLIETEVENMDCKIGFIGAGNMTKAFVSRWVHTFPEINSKIFISNRTKRTAEKICKEFKVNLSMNNIDLVKNCSIIILAVKPNGYKDVLNEIKEYISEKHIIVSMAAGISINYMQEIIKKEAKIVRTMPNTPVLVGEGMTAIAYNQNISKEEISYVLNLFESMGRADVIDEKLMDVATAISGSSPAFVYIFIEALADGGVLQGMSREKAYKYAAQAVLGGAKLILEGGKHPGEFKDMVCTPGGTAIEAIYSLEKGHFRGTVMEAMNNCVEKARFLAYK